MSRELYSFRLILDGPPLTPTLVNRLVEARCHDAMFAEEQGVKIAYFERAGRSFEDAVLRAIADVDAVEGGIAVVRVEPDDLVTAGGIAERTDRTRQNVAQLVSGVRGRGGFPPPISVADGRVRVWRWTDVQSWFARRAGETPPKDPEAHFVAAVNGALDARRYLARYRREGGAPVIARAVESLMRGSSGTPPERVAAGHLVVGSGAAVAVATPSPLDVTAMSGADTLREVARRTQADVSFLATSILPELTRKLERTRSWLEKTLEQAVAAYETSVRFRLEGDLASAVLLDHKVFENVRRMLESSRYELYALPFRDTVERDVYCVIDESVANPQASLYSWNLHLSSALLGAMDRCVDLVLDAPRERQDAASLRAVVDGLLGADHEVPSTAITLACLRSPSSGRWVNLDFGDEDAPFADWQSFSHVRWGSRAYEASAVRLLMSSWTFTSALRLLTERHLPEELPAVADVVGRIENDLAAWAG